MKVPLPEELRGSSARRVWEHFFALSAIPRPPGGEEGVREYLQAIAGAAGWEWERDRVGNVVLRVPGRGSLAGGDPLVLQAHMDMVCEKEPGVEHDFTTDPLRLVIEGGWLRASGTTLGADNGIGVALALAVAQADAAGRVPLELLFTVDEESGLTGAMKLDAGLLRGRRLVNLDSESEGVFIVSCAGGRSVTVRFQREAGGSPLRASPVRCRLGGLRGGHSGIDISGDRVNALAAAVAVLAGIRQGRDSALLLSLHGGTKINVIPREAEFVVTGIEADEVRRHAQGVIDHIKAAEPLAFAAVNPGEEVVSSPLPWETVGFAEELPQGVIAMDHRIPALVHTSVNLGVARSDEGGARLQAKVRSADDERRDAQCGQILALARRWGGEGDTGDAYPGWSSSSSTRLVRSLNGTYRKLFGRSAAVRGIHAGLEAGVIGAMLGTGELVSLGPTIENAHSPGERLLLESVKRVQRLLEAFVAAPALGEP